jgi:hypothetical protein
MARFSLVLIIAGGFLGYFGYREWQLQAGASAEPEKIALDALIKRGTGGNPHVEVTDFYFPGRYVVLTKDNAWNQVYFPAEPLTGAKIAGAVLAQLFGAKGQEVKEARAIMVIKSVHDQNALEQFVQSHESVKGMVINSVHSLESKAQELLRENFPKTNFDRVIMIEADRAPWGAGQVTLMLIGAAALIVLGVGSFLWRYLSAREQPYRGPESFTPPGTSEPERA